ncbi:hypothetical protein [Sphingomonas morindae]|uniref:Uncharacterized protein n=1 Tax=Sphingomonas morindae TaxID=1541170 RepID=A0ABY4X755_9SPHN|nr:hypothetical protein [Sphingomonas morindae]USI72729.1 hypothetical protein LHA26_15870 [Sphingomonas morindae]
MVGDPKSLTDLRKIEAGVQVTCRQCGRVKLLDREQLIADLVRRCRPLTWSTLPAQLRCACGSKRVYLVAMPFAGRDGPLEPLVQRLVAAADRMVAALGRASTAAPALREMAEARMEFEQAKRALLTWSEGR